jgi:hypothetical protein
MAGACSHTQRAVLLVLPRTWSMEWGLWPLQSGLERALQQAGTGQSLNY